MLSHHLLLFVTATFLLVLYLLPVAVVLGGGGEAGHNPTLAYYAQGIIIWPYIWDIYGMVYIIFHFLVRNIGCGTDKAILDACQLYQLVDDRVDFSCVHIRYFIGYVYHIRLQDTIQSTLSLCLLCKAMLLPLPPRPLLLTTRSGFTSLPLYSNGQAIYTLTRTRGQDEALGP